MAIVTSLLVAQCYQYTGSCEEELHVWDRAITWVIVKNVKYDDIFQVLHSHVYII